ncbi:MAG: damage-inducible protein DinB [Acidobacteria bacterium]|nr:MAG: damage-inducible protein DinB [Acidobacteriota bacterium]
MNINEIRRLYAYTEWANRLVLEAAEKLSTEQLIRDVKISHNSILGTLLHMAGAEWIWLERWHGHSPTDPDAWKPWTVEACGNLQQLGANWQPVVEKRRAYLAGLTDADLPGERSFKRLNGETYSMPLVEQMQHVVNHATLHRGQVVGMIRQLGFTPPATDLLFYLIVQPK